MNEASTGQTQPERSAFSHEEAITKANEWMRENYPEQPKSDRYHERLGLLIDFLHSLHPPT